MDNYCIDIFLITNILIALISAIAAVCSACFAHKTRKMQSKLVAKHDDIQRLSKLIDQLKELQATKEDSSSFNDEKFLEAYNQLNLCENIAILKQTSPLHKILGKFDWKNPHEGTNEKMKALDECRKLLF